MTLKTFYASGGHLIKYAFYVVESIKGATTGFPPKSGIFFGSDRNPRRGNVVRLSVRVSVYFMQ